MSAQCPLFDENSVICRVKKASQHRWVSSEQTWYIRNYCETDVLNTYLVYLRYLLMRGQLNDQSYAQQQQRLLDYLKSHPQQLHWQQFVEHWQIN